VYIEAEMKMMTTRKRMLLTGCCDIGKTVDQTLQRIWSVTETLIQHVMLHRHFWLLKQKPSRVIVV
jgi:hypothetical protein